MLDVIAESSSSSGDSKRNKKRLDASQIRELKEFGSRVNKLGVNFAVCDVNSEIALLCDGGKRR